MSIFMLFSPYLVELAGSEVPISVGRALIFLPVFLSLCSGSKAFPVCPQGARAVSAVTVHIAEDRSAILYSSSGTFCVRANFSKNNYCCITGSF